MAKFDGPAVYAYNDTSLPEAEREYLKLLADYAASQDLSEDMRDYVRAVTVAFTVFAAVVVCLRFWARHLQAAKILIDDYLMLMALVMLVGNMIMNLVLVDHGIGLHSGRLPLEEIQFLSKTMIGAEILYVTTINQYKIALLFLYLRIFPTQQVRKGAIWCGGLTAAWTIACVVAASAQCTPLWRLWEPWTPGFCIDLFLTQLCISIPSILVDIGILALPIPHVMKLQMATWQRVLVLFAFLMGSYVVFTSCYRFRVFLDYSTADVPWTLADGLAWNVIELSSGIVSACFPTLGPIVRVVFRGLTSVAESSGLAKYAKSSGSRGAASSSVQHQSASRGVLNSWAKLPEGSHGAGGVPSQSDASAKFSTNESTVAIDLGASANHHGHGHGRDLSGSDSDDLELGPLDHSHGHRVTVLSAAPARDHADRG